MKVNSSVVSSFVAGAVLASLPFTLSLGKANAQVSNPPKPGSVPAQIDQVVYGNDNFLYISSGSMIYKIRPVRLAEGQWWTMPGLPK